MNKFFLYDPEGDGMQLFETAEARDVAATDAIKLYLDSEGWSEDVTSVIVGEVTGRATMCDVMHPEGELDDECVDGAGVYWGDQVASGVEPHEMTMCNYRIEPVGHNVGGER